MPLTEVQRRILAALAPRRRAEGYLAGGAALHFAPNSVRYSHDLDFFHDSARRVAEAFADDSAILESAGYGIRLVFSQPGFIRAVVTLANDSTQVDWAHDSTWRFMPLVEDDLGGFLLHSVDLAVNKVLALAGRDEPRDLLDILYVHDAILPLGPVVWAAVGKDPGFSPHSLLEHVRRSGRFRAEDFARLDLARPFDVEEAKVAWLAAVAEAERFLETRPADEVGCLYYAPERGRFEEPSPGAELEGQGLVVHFGRPGGVVPRPSDQGLF